MRDWWGCSVYWSNGLRQRTKCNPATAREFVALLLEQGARLVVLDGERIGNRIRADSDGA